jgi:hypothetical protein
VAVVVVIDELVATDIGTFLYQHDDFEHRSLFFNQSHTNPAVVSSCIAPRWPSHRRCPVRPANGRFRTFGQRRAAAVRRIVRFFNRLPVAGDLWMCGLSRTLQKKRQRPPSAGGGADVRL